MYIIAEIGVNHDGSLEKALKLIDAAVECGCSAVKFQSFYADRLVHKDCLKVDYQLRSNKNNESHYEMIKRLEFNGTNFLKVFNYSRKLNIDFITTPYDSKSIEEVYQIGVRNFKTASADLTDIYIHTKLSNLENINTYIATGMSDTSKINSTLKLYKKENPKILHCVSGYPCEDNSLNLNCLNLLKTQFKKNKIGFSDHSIGLTSSIIAATLGYTFFERHFTLDKNDNGPDHYASSDISEMKNYVKELNRVKPILGSDFKNIQNEEIGMSKRSKKAILAKRNLFAGEELSIDNTYALRPAEMGISVDEFNNYLGKKFKKDIKKNKFLQITDFE